MNDMEWKCPYCGAKNDANDEVINFIEVANNSSSEKKLTCSKCGKKAWISFRFKSIEYYIANVEKG